MNAKTILDTIKKNPIIQRILVFKDTNPALFFFLFFLFWAIWLSFLYWGLGAFSYLRVHDTGDGNLLYRVVATQDLIQYGITTWRPEFLGGVDALTLPGLPHFLFDSLPFIVLPPWLAYGLLMLIQRFVASYFTFRLCRDCLGMDVTSSIYAGFAFSLLEWSLMDWTLYYGLGLPAAPLFLWVIERILMMGDYKKYIFAFVAGILLYLIAPVVLFIPFFWGFVFLWFVFIREVRKPSFVLIYVLFIFGTLALAAPEIWALLANAPLTGRTSSYDIGIDNLVRGFVQDATIEIISVLLILAALFITRLKDKTLLKLVALCLFIEIVSRLFTFLSPWIAVHMSYLATFTLNRFGQFVYMLVPITGGYSIYAISNFFSEDKKDRISGFCRKLSCGFSNFGTTVGSCGICACLICSLLLNVTIVTYLPSDNYYINYENPALKQLAINESGEQFRVATVGCKMATTKQASRYEIYPAYAAIYGFETIDGYNSFHLKRFSDYWGIVIDPAVEKDERLKSNKEGYITRWMYLYAPFNGSFEKKSTIEFSEYYNLNLLSLANTKYLISRWALNHSSLKPVYIPPGSYRDTDAWEKQPVTSQIIAYLQGEKPARALYIYENKDVFPRIFVVSKIKTFDTSAALLDGLKKARIEEIRTTAFLNSSDIKKSSFINMNAGNVQINITGYTPDRISLDVETEGPGILVITNNYSPYWQCDVNGDPCKIFPVYHSFQGVLISKGKNEITLLYKPPYNIFTDDLE
ncbi:MAG: DUF6044 family protein [Methanoregula sp.]